MSRFARNRDYYAAAVIALIGLGAAWQGAQYGIGTLTAMGSGFFPVCLGTGMVLMAVLMAALRPAPLAAEGAPAEVGHAAVQAPNWRGAAAIIGAVALFILLANRAGLAPATFACVFMGALGTTSTRLVEAALLALGVTVFGVLLFRYGLQVQFPILRGVLQ